MTLAGGWPPELFIWQDEVLLQHISFNLLYKGGNEGNTELAG